MVEIISSQKIKIIPWPKGENHVVYKRTKNEIIFMGLNKYLKNLHKRKTKDRNKNWNTSSTN